MKIKKIDLFIVSIYIAITQAFYLLPASLFVYPIGKFYDVILLFAILTMLFGKHGKIGLDKVDKKIVTPFFLWILFCMMETLNALQYQGIVGVVRGVRENFLFLSFFILICHRRDLELKRVIIILLRLEIVGAVIYIIQAVISTPFLKTYYYQQKIGLLTVSRCYADMPLLAMFSIPYLFFGIMEKKYVKNKKKDLLMLLIFVIAIVVKWQRSYYMCLAIILSATVLLAKTKWGIEKKSMICIAALFCIMILIPKYFPNLTAYFNTAFSEYKDGAGNGLLRVNSFLARLNYLMKNNKLLCGFGPLSTDYILVGLNDYRICVRNNDMSYATLIVRYGVIGLLLYVSIWLYYGCYALKTKTKLGKSVFIFVLTSLFLGLVGEFIIDYHILLLGIVLGLLVNGEKKRVAEEQRI